MLLLFLFYLNSFLIAFPTYKPSKCFIKSCCELVEKDCNVATCRLCLQEYHVACVRGCVRVRVFCALLSELILYILFLLTQYSKYEISSVNRF